MSTNQIQCIRANAGECQGLTDGMVLLVMKETPAFFFLEAPVRLGNLREIKVSKKTKLGSTYRQHNAPVFSW